MKSKFINLFAGPGAGKSTTAAGVFYELKTRGYNAELVPEFAKDLVWEGRIETLSRQVYVTARQYHMIEKLKDKAEFIVTDSPVLLGSVYADGHPYCYTDTLVWCHHRTSTPGLNFFIDRSDSFSDIGRVHNEERSRRLDEEIRILLEENDISYTRVTKEDAVNDIVTRIIDDH